MKPEAVRRPPLTDGPGGGRQLVLVHGAMDRGSSFTRLAARLRDWTVVTYDRRGYNRSAGMTAPTDFSVQVEDLLDVIGDEPAVAFGHSLGGDVVLAAMAARPALLPAALVWEPPQPWRPDWPHDRSAEELGPADRAEAFMRRMVGDRMWDRLPAATREQRRSEGEALAADLVALRRGPVWDPVRIRNPVLVGRGGRSRPHQRRGARELAAELTDAELVEIADAEHGAHLSHPGEVAGLLVRAADLAGW